MKSFLLTSGLIPLLLCPALSGASNHVFFQSSVDRDDVDEDTNPGILKQLHVFSNSQQLPLRVAQPGASRDRHPHSATPVTSKTQTITFDKILTHGNLQSIPASSYPNLIFSPHFFVANSSEYSIPTTVSPQTPPNLALVFLDHESSPPSLNSADSSLFALNRLALGPTEHGHVTTFSACFSVYRQDVPLCWGCRLAIQMEGEGGMKTAENPCNEWVDRVEVEAFVGGVKSSFAVDDLEVEWEVRPITL